MRKRLVVFVIIILSGTYIYAQTSVDPLMTTKWQTFQWPLNAAYPTCGPDVYGVVNGHMGNSCGPTAIAKMLHYHKHPVNGSGSHQLTDQDGLYYHADFENTYYEWKDMKDDFASNATESSYMPTALLILHAFVLMEDPYQTGRSLADVNLMLKKYMRYDQGSYVAYRFDYTREEYIALLKNELDEGRPLLIESWTSTSPPPGSGGNHEGHYWNIDGYDEQDRFHIVWNCGDYDAWFDIEDIQDIQHGINAHYLWALIGFKPDNTQRVVSLTSPVDNYMLEINQPLSISWEARNLENIHIDFTYDGAEWITIAEGLPGNQSVFEWSGPTTYTKSAAFRFRDANNKNYDFVYKGFEVYETKGLDFVTPVSNDSYEIGTDICVSWLYDGVYKLKLEYKESGSENWILIQDGIKANQKFWSWSKKLDPGCVFDLKLSNEGQEFVSIAESMTISTTEQTGGPYKPDVNSVLLMHFDKNLNEVANGVIVSPYGVNPDWEYSAPGKGSAALFDHSEAGYKNMLVIPHQAYLSFQSSFTIDFWFNIRSWSKTTNNKPVILTKPVFSIYSNYSLEGDSDKGTVLFRTRTNHGPLSVSCTEGIIVPGIWYHVAMIHEAETQELRLLIHNSKKERIDSQLVSYSEGFRLEISESDLYVGGDPARGDNFDGMVDELRISRGVREFDAVWSDIQKVRFSGEWSLKIFPNPASGITYIDFSIESAKYWSLSMMDVSGRQVFFSSSDLREGSASGFQIDLRSLRPGIYWILAVVDGQTKGKKLVVY